MLQLIDQANKELNQKEELEFDEELDLKANIDMHFSFPRDHIEDLFEQKQLDEGKSARKLTKDEYQDLIWALSSYIEEQLYSMYQENLDADGYIDEFIQDQLPIVN